MWQPPSIEEFAPKNRITEIIEININNLAAVPSVVFVILGLAVFIGIFGMPRSIPLIGGVVLALMTLPTIISSLPPSVRCRQAFVTPRSALVRHVCRRRFITLCHWRCRAC